MPCSVGAFPIRTQGQSASFSQACTILARSVWAQRVPVPVLCGGTMVDANARKRKPDDLDKRLGEVELRQESREQGLDGVQYRLEESQSYRYVRVEGSTSLAQLWASLEKGDKQRSGIRAAVETGLVAELRAVFIGIRDEDGLQAKSSELSSGKRSVSTAAARDTMLQTFSLSGFVEWVQKDSTGWRQVSPRAWPLLLSRKTSIESCTRCPKWAQSLPSSKCIPIVVRRRGQKERLKGRARGPEEKGEPVAMARDADKAETLRSLEAGRVLVTGRGQ